MLTKEEIEKKYPGKKLEDIKVLNFYGNDFDNIDIISQMKSLKIISLSSNKISSLKPFMNLQNLKELIIRNNNIENVDEIDYLKNCDKLSSLWLEENPVCKKEEYKEHLIKTLPNLKNLDNTNMTEIKEEIEKNKNDKNENGMSKNKSKEKTNKTITYNEDKLEDLLLDYEKENNIELNEDNKDNNENKKEDNNKNKLLGSKSDIFKSEFINKDETSNKETEIPTKENSEINKTDNNNITESNKESKSSLGFSKIQMGSLVNDPNSDILNDILRNVDTSQSIIRKNNSNPVNAKSPNLDILNNKNTNIKHEDPKEKMNINSNLTKNLNDLLKDAKLDNNNNNIIPIQSKNNDTEINNILNNVDTSQTIVNKNDKEINNILNNVDTSQTIHNKKDKEVSNILKDVQTTNSNLSEFELNNDKNNNNFQSIEDIRKMFNNDYKPNGMSNISNIYGNNNIRDTKINNIFKSEMITSDSFTRNSSSKQNGPYKPDFNIPNNMQNYNYYGYENQNYNQRRNYNIKPSHEHKINAITNLLEDLNFENLMIVKNHIINKLNGQQ